MQITFIKKMYAFEYRCLYLPIKRKILFFSIFQLSFFFITAPYSVNLLILIVFLIKITSSKRGSGKNLRFLLYILKRRLLKSIFLCLLIVFFDFLHLIFKDINTCLYHPVYFYFSNGS